MRQMLVRRSVTLLSAAAVIGVGTTAIGGVASAAVASPTPPSTTANPPVVALVSDHQAGSWKAAPQLTVDDVRAPVGDYALAVVHEATGSMNKTTTATDSAGNTWTTIATYVDPGYDTRTVVVTAPVIFALKHGKVTFAFGGQSYVSSVDLTVWSGVREAVTDAAGGSGNAVTQTSPATVTVDEAGDVVVSALTYTAGAPVSTTPGSTSGSGSSSGGGGTASTANAGVSFGRGGGDSDGDSWNSWRRPPQVTTGWKAVRSERRSPGFSTALAYTTASSVTQYGASWKIPSSSYAAVTVALRPGYLNLLGDGSFEVAGTGGVAANWYDYYDTAAAPYFGSAWAGVTEGDVSQELALAPQPADNGTQLVEILQSTTGKAPYPIVGGGTYTFNMNVSGICAKCSVVAGLAWFDSSGNYIGESDDYFTPTTAPQLISRTATVPANAARISVYLEVPELYATSAFDLYMDEAYLYTTTTPAAHHPTSTPSGHHWFEQAGSGGHTRVITHPILKERPRNR